MSERDPLMRRLADANPVPPGTVKGSSASPSADRLLGDVLAGRQAVPPQKRARLTLVLASMVLGLVAVAAILVAVPKDRPATAAELLRQTAAIAAAREAPDITGKYLYTKIVAEDLTTDAGDRPWSVIVPVVEETWIAPDGSGRIRSVIGEPRFPGPRDQKRWEAAGSPEIPSGTSDNTFPLGSLPYEDVASLPTNPNALRDELEGQVASEDLPLDIAVFLRIGELLGRGDAPPELRAGLYRVASTLPGIELTGPIADPLGREGVGVSMSYTDAGAAVRVQLAFDDETSVLLSREEILLEPASWVDAKPGSRVEFIAFVASGRIRTVQGTL
jgi:hypothetical protein